jgi:hypothetical protein
MKTKTQLFLLCLVAFSLLSNIHLRAAPLNLTAGPPDFIASSLFVNFVYGSNSFSAEGLTTSYQGGSVPLVGSGSYSLTAYINTYIDPSGYLGFGSLTIKGDIGTGPETLLSGTLNTGLSGTAFGFQDPPGGNIFEFLFTVTGGDPIVVSDFGGLGSSNHGVIVNAHFENGGIPFNGTWASGFRNDGHSGDSDTFAQAPEPSATILLMVGIGVLALLRRSRPGKLLSLAITR